MQFGRIYGKSTLVAGLYKFVWRGNLPNIILRLIELLKSLSP